MLCANFPIAGHSERNNCCYESNILIDLDIVCGAISMYHNFCLPHFDSPITWILSATYTYLISYVFTRADNLWFSAYHCNNKCHILVGKSSWEHTILTSFSHVISIIYDERVYQPVISMDLHWCTLLFKSDGIFFQAYKSDTCISWINL